jgi:hypothetical protein
MRELEFLVGRRHENDPEKYQHLIQTGIKQRMLPSGHQKLTQIINVMARKSNGKQTYKGWEMSER